jgi:hypothetical protein
MEPIGMIPILAQKYIEERSGCPFMFPEIEEDANEHLTREQLPRFLHLQTLESSESNK